VRVSPTALLGQTEPNQRADYTPEDCPDCNARGEAAESVQALFIEVHRVAERRIVCGVAGWQAQVGVGLPVGLRCQAAERRHVNFNYFSHARTLSP
jgi:hypothetical protein